MAKRKVARASVDALVKKKQSEKEANRNALIEAMHRLRDRKPINVPKGAKLNKSNVVREAGVSRPTLYKHADILGELEKLMEKPSRSPAAARRLAKAEQERREEQRKAIIDQLLVDKQKLAQENYRLAREYQEMTELLEARDREISELKQKLARASVRSV